MANARAGVAVASSVFAGAALAAWAAERYALAAPVSCHLHRAGMNDTYLLDHAGGRTVLRVYRHGWRTAEAIAGEIALLRWLQEAGVALAAPIVGRDGREIAVLDAPEGQRPAVLFAFAAGEQPRADAAHGARLGDALAALHSAAHGFRVAGARPLLDLTLLLHEPARVILPALAGQPDNAACLRELVARLSAAIEPLASRLDWGAVHGDPWAGNARLDAGGRITWFDFDLCGDGWRSYDLAVQRISMRVRGADGAWPAFLAGYMERRPLPAVDRDAIPLFVAVRDIWQLGYHLANAAGGAESWWLDATYLDSRLRTMRDWAWNQLGWQI